MLRGRKALPALLAASAGQRGAVAARGRARPRPISAAGGRPLPWLPGTGRGVSGGAAFLPASTHAVVLNARTVLVDNFPFPCAYFWRHLVSLGPGRCRSPFGGAPGGLLSGAQGPGAPAPRRPKPRE